MNIRKGHITGFVFTVLFFGIIFFYIYMNTQETGWLYNIKNATKENLGRNIYNAVFNENEEYMASVTYNGNLKLIKIQNPKETLFSNQNVNACFFYKDLLIITNTEGDTFSYNIKTLEKRNYKFDSFNKYVCLVKNNLISIDSSTIKIMNLDNDEEIKEIKFEGKYNSNDDIFVGKDYICIFDKSKAYVYKYPEFNSEKFEINDYSSKGIFKNNVFVYVNSKGETVINNVIIKEILNPHSVLYSEKTNLILIADSKKAICFNEKGNKIWEKDIISNKIFMNNQGTEFACIHNKIQGSVFDFQKGEEKFSMDVLKKVVFSPSDNLILAVKKSTY